MQDSSRRQFVVGALGAALAACGGAGQTQPAPAVPGSSEGTPAGSGPDTGGAGMQLRPFGKTGEQVSMIGLGGFHIGKGIAEDESIRLVREAVDNGITFMDNCWDYNEGQSEVRMGKALADGYRQRVLLMTKIDGRTAQSAMAQLEQSLRRLQTDMIDLVQIHEVIHASDPARCFGPGGTIEALVRARAEGKLRYIGFTGHKHPDLHLAMLEAADEHKFQFDAVQLPLNVMDAHFQSFEARVLPALLERKIAVLGMKALGAGDILASGVVSAEECLRYALGLPTSVVITGIESRNVLEQALRVGRSFRPFSEGERTALLARTRDAAQGGKHELFKTSEKYDGTARNPHWLERAEL